MALHFPADDMSCQCSNIHLQFVFLEESHNIPKETIYRSLFFRRRKRQKHSYFHGFLVCFLTHYTFVAEMRSKICTKYTLTTYQEQHATLILHVKSELILLTTHSTFTKVTIMFSLTDIYEEKKLKRQMCCIVFTSCIEYESY